jgi:hypothetical protein
MTVGLIVGAVAGMWVLVAHAGGPSFSNTPLLLSFGSSEPGIAFSGGFMAIDSLSWLLPNGTQLWTGDFGATPTLQGAIDSALTKAGFTVAIGGGDANVAFDSSGTLRYYHRNSNQQAVPERSNLDLGDPMPGRHIIRFQHERLLRADHRFCG